MTQEITLYRVRSRTLQDAGITVGACALGIGLICAVFYGNRQYEALRPAEPERSASVERPAPAAVVSSPGAANPVANNPRPAIDQSPVFETARVVITDLPVAPMATKTPVPALRPASQSARGGKDAAQDRTPADVVRFDRCRPECETQDPLIVGPPAEYQQMTGPSFVVYAEEPGRFSLSPLQGARYLLNHTAAAPRAALRKGREVIGRIVGYDE